MNVVSFFSFAISFVNIIKCRPVSHNDIKKAYIYLKKYHYLDENENLIFNIMNSNGLKSFQRMAHLSETGVLDDNTLTAMKWKRCGSIDNGSSRKKRFAFQGSQWANNNVSFRISKYSNSLERYKVDSEIIKAFSIWSKHSNLTFNQIWDNKSKVDIDIRFITYQHGDGENFDGPGHVIAHAFYPNEGGYTHFDDSEIWTNENGISGGLHLYQVATHEIGHALGLFHSDKRESVMTPIYKEWENNMDLDLDDIKAIQLLYGKPDMNKVKMSKGDNSEQSLLTNKICSLHNIDAFIMIENQSVYGFHGPYYWTIDMKGVGEIKYINQTWKDITFSIDTAFHWHKMNKTYFFKGNKYWRYTNEILDINYPKLISQGFKGIPNNISTVFEWNENGAIYFTKGPYYYRYAGSTKKSVDPFYPKPLKLWTGIPLSVDAVLRWKNKRTYFFSGQNYYRFNDEKFRTDRTYPRMWKTWWLGCGKSRLISSKK